MELIIWIVFGIVFAATGVLIFRLVLWDLVVQYTMPLKGAILLGPFAILYFLPGGAYDSIFADIWDATRIFEGSRHAQHRGREGRYREIGRLIDSLTSAATGQAKNPKDTERVTILRQMWWDLKRKRRLTYGDEMRVLTCRDELNQIWYLFQYGNLTPITDLARTSASLPPEWRMKLGGRFGQKLVLGALDPIPEAETQFWQPYADFKVEGAKFAFFYPFKHEQIFGTGISVTPPSPVTAKAMFSSPKAQRLADQEPMTQAEIKTVHRMRDEYTGKILEHVLGQQVIKLAMAELGIGEGRLPLFSGGNLGMRQGIIIVIGGIAGMAVGAFISPPGQAIPYIFPLTLLGSIIAFVIAISGRASSSHI